MLTDNLQHNFESHMSSVQELRDVSIELEPRVSSIWKKPLPKIIMKNKTNQQIYYDKYLKKQVSQVPKFLQIPSQEMLYAREKQYLPEKVKILMTKNMHLDSEPRLFNQYSTNSAMIRSNDSGIAIR